MLRIYDDSLVMVGLVRPYIERIKRHSSNLADQCDRASTSVPLNIAEGAFQARGNRIARYRTALAEANETRACLETAVHAKFIDGVDPVVLDKLGKIIGTLVRCVR